MKCYPDPSAADLRPGLPEKCGQLGALRSGPLVADYTFYHPDPEQWVAVSVVSAAATADAPLYSPHMLVSTGASRGEAVVQLQQCLDDLVQAACP
jgi:hypothetical protein